MGVTEIRRLVTASLVMAGSVFAAAAPQISATAAARFLEQASWGPTPSLIAEVQKQGFEGWIDAQMALGSSKWSAIPDPSVNANGNTSARPFQDAFFANAVTGEDQLRQRVAFALSQIWVVSGVKLKPEALAPYLRLLQTDAFTTYDRLMYDVTLSPAMGRYLDMVNNARPTPGHAADENYAREILQLFTLGLVELDQYGRPKLDTKGNPIPTYSQDTIEGFARAFTGWTYGPKPNAVSKFPNPANWNAPMDSHDGYHDTDPDKVLLNGYTLPPHQTAQQDLKDALNNIFQHPNLGPFVCRQLIQHLVTSAPSDMYVARVVAVFNGNPRGDLKAVVKAILTDPEARAGDDGSASKATHLREPVLWINTLLRGLDATVAASNNLVGVASGLGQPLYYSPTVFNYFLPGYQVGVSGSNPPATVNAPEFQLMSEATAIATTTAVNSLVYGKVAGVTPDITPYLTILGAKPAAADVSRMVDALNVSLMGGRMTAPMHDTIVKAASAATTPKAMVQSAVYLIATSWDFQVER